MFQLNCQLFLGPLPSIDFVHEIKIESSWKTFTDTATITLPRNISIIGSDAGLQLQDVLQVGDPVTISYGYDGYYRTEFSGVITVIRPGTPFTLSCEDKMWHLKRKQMSKAWRSVSLRELLTYIQQQYVEFFPPRGFPFHLLGNTQLGRYTINQATGAQVFADLKKRLGLSFFFREGVLMANTPYVDPSDEHLYGFGQNIIESDLAFTKASDMALHFTGTSLQVDGRKIQFDYSPQTEAVHLKYPAERRHKGDPLPAPTVNAANGKFKGEQHTLIAPPNLSGKQLEKFVREAAARLCFDGYRSEGGILSFGIPIANHGDIAEIIDLDYPERAGRYWIDAVTKTFGVGGSRRLIKLGPKAPGALSKPVLAVDPYERLTPRGPQLPAPRA